MRQHSFRVCVRLRYLVCLRPLRQGKQFLPGRFKVRWPKTREGRRVEARNWLKEISDIDNQIPTLSPAEAAWLKVEYDDELA